MQSVVVPKVVAPKEMTPFPIMPQHFFLHVKTIEAKLNLSVS
jgi:hypothetical protein